MQKFKINNIEIKKTKKPIPPKNRQNQEHQVNKLSGNKLKCGA